MRGGVVAGGVALIIVGIIFFSISNTTIGGATGPGGGVGGYRTENQIFLMIGVGLGIVGFITLIAGLAASKKEKPVLPQKVMFHPPFRPAVAPEVLVICPECSSHVSAKSKFCPECGEKLGPKQKAKQREVEEGETEMLKPAKGTPKKVGFCMYCGTELPEGADFCPECGRKVKS